MLYFDNDYDWNDPLARKYLLYKGIYYDADRGLLYRNDKVDECQHKEYSSSYTEYYAEYCEYRHTESLAALGASLIRLCDKEGYESEHYERQ